MRSPVVAAAFLGSQGYEPMHLSEAELAARRELNRRGRVQHDPIAGGQSTCQELASPVRQPGASSSLAHLRGSHGCIRQRSCTHGPPRPVPPQVISRSGTLRRSG